MNGTFSSSTHGVSLLLDQSKTSPTSPDRAPEMPLVAPACDRSWQGNPATTSDVSFGSRFSVQMSSCSGMPGNLVRSTSIAGGSFSQNIAVRCPARCNPRSSPPMPANRPATTCCWPSGALPLLTTLACASRAGRRHTGRSRSLSPRLLEQRPLIRDVLLCSIAHDPRERHLLRRRDALELLVDVARETHRCSRRPRACRRLWWRPFRFRSYRDAGVHHSTPMWCIRRQAYPTVLIENCRRCLDR